MSKCNLHLFNEQRIILNTCMYISFTWLSVIMAPEILKRKIKDGWGVTHERGTKVVKGYYFEKINNNILNYRLVKNVIAYICPIFIGQTYSSSWYIYWFTSIDWEWSPWYFVCNWLTWKLKMWTKLF